MRLGYWPANLRKKDSAYQVLIEHASDLRNTVRLGAIRALGALQDERAIGVLTNFTGGREDAPENAAAKRAIEQIRSAKPIGNELQALRTEVLDLKKQNADLKKSFEELRKQVQAREEKTAAPVEKQARKSPTPAGKRR